MDGTAFIPEQNGEETSGKDRSRDFEAYRMIRDQIQHEDLLISQRFNWFVMAHSFLFTAYAIVLTSYCQLRLSGKDVSLLILLLKVVPMIAILSSLLISGSMFAGMLAMRELQKFYYGRLAAPGAHHMPPIQGSRLTSLPHRSFRHYSSDVGYFSISTSDDYRCYG
jgi:hypothetical protein